MTLADCKVGTIYRVRGRNFTVAVYMGDGKFMGVRHKFGQKFLTMEYAPTDADGGALTFGTVVAILQEMGAVPDGVEIDYYSAPLQEALEAIDRGA